jgi:ketosteroid isomerase-like protein
MSQENVELVRDAYGAASRGDWEAAFNATAPDFEFIPPDRVPDAQPVKGAAAATAWWEDQRETVGDMSTEVEEFRDAGDCVVVFLRMHVFPRATDASFELSIAHVCTLRDGKLARLQVFPNRDETLEAAGLRE